MNILEQIYQDKLVEVRTKKKQKSAQIICQEINCTSHNIKHNHAYASRAPENQRFSGDQCPTKDGNWYQIKDFVSAIEQKLAKNQVVIIAEVKKASPSKGIIREDFNPVSIAKAYQNNGATCLSVLTDEKYFMGKNEYLSQIRQNVDLPILRKDFIIDPYQIWEAKLIGADCILLIMAMLDEARAIELEQVAIEAGLAVLIEIHDEEDLLKALKLKSRLIGINNRNLKTFATNLETSKNLAPKIPQNKIIICESGIFCKKDILEMQKIGINCFLIGEFLMRQDDIGQALMGLTQKHMN